MNSARLSVKNIQGAPLVGGYRLGFGIAFALSADALDSFRPPSGSPSKVWRRTRFWDISGSASVARPGVPGLFLGRLFPEHTVWLETSGEAQEQYRTLFLELTPHQLEALETLRVGGPLDFTVQLTALSTSWRMDDQCTPLESGLEYRAARPDTDHLTYRATQSDWLKVLEDMKYGQFLLFEIPMPKGSAEPAVPNSTASLKAAQQHLLLGQYDDSVGDCRLALEAFWGEQRIAAEIKTVGSPPKGSWPPKRERFLRTHKAIKLLMDCAMHADRPILEPFSRTEALCVLQLAAALLGLSALPASLNTTVPSEEGQGRDPTL